MLSGPNHACSEEVLELYALGRTRRTLTARVEEHLLLCARCRKRLDELTEEVRVIRAALSEHERESGLTASGREAAAMLRSAGNSRDRLCAVQGRRSSRRTA